MDIAKTKDGRFILYALNGKTKKVGNADVNSLVIKTTSGSEQNSNSNGIVPQNSEKSSDNTSHSLSPEDVQAVMHGDYHVTGDDVRFAPVREDIAEKSQNKPQKAQKLSNPPPLRKDIAKNATTTPKSMYVTPIEEINVPSRDDITDEPVSITTVKERLEYSKKQSNSYKVSCSVPLCCLFSAEHQYNSLLTFG